MKEELKNYEPQGTPLFKDKASIVMDGKFNDGNNHVNNAGFPYYFDKERYASFGARGITLPFLAEKYGLVILIPDYYVSCRTEVREGDIVDLTTRLYIEGRKKFVFVQEMSLLGSIGKVTQTTEAVLVDATPNKRRIRDIPLDLQERLKQPREKIS